MSRFTVVVLLLCFILPSCVTTTVSQRVDLARALASSAQMVERNINAAPFVLRSYARVTDPALPVHLYIEGDGLAWISRSVPSADPTPTDPVALRLAARDTAANVIYLARPCQYEGLLDAQADCSRDYWLDKRFAPEVIAAYGSALDDIKQQYGVATFDLVGFSGGAAVAALVAARRDDVESLRSVAGNLDHREHSRIHKVSYLEDSLNPTDYSAALFHIPQHHFIGGRDKVVPVAIYQSYAAAMPSQHCLRSTIIPSADHVEGWVHQWPQLLKENIRCG